MNRQTMKTIVASTIIVVFLTASAMQADAARRRSRGPSASKRYQQMVREYQQRLQAQLKANMERQQILDQFVLEKFDENHNGKIEGAERGPTEHFLRDMRTGNEHDRDSALLNELREDLSKVKVQVPAAKSKAKPK